ncbi:MAG: GNAT family N-acetyltransferase [Rhodospirillaceae bacterium]|nr:GNAT family N-acetyltransferase [Rhodospirillaceae bacterium]
MLVYGEDEFVSEWVAGLIPHVSSFGPCSAIGVVSNDKLLAGVVYHDYQPMFDTIQLSIAAVSPMWARKENIRGLLEYPFENLGCYRVWTAVPIDNEKALKVNAHIGFHKETIAHSGFGKNRHAVISRMLLPDYIRLYGD